MTHPAIVATDDIFQYAQRVSFASMTAADFSGLQSACRRVYDLMRDGEWHTAQAIIDASGQREGLRRMREVRDVLKFTIETDRPGDGREFRYRLVMA